jgi:hypothetical protein
MPLEAGTLLRDARLTTSLASRQGSTICQWKVDHPAAARVTVVRQCVTSTQAETPPTSLCLARTPLGMSWYFHSFVICSDDGGRQYRDGALIAARDRFSPPARGDDGGVIAGHRYDFRKAINAALSQDDSLDVVARQGFRPSAGGARA